MTKRILLATDGSENARKAADFAADLAANSGSELVIAHVLQHGRPAEEIARMAEVEHLIERTGRKPMPHMENVAGTLGELFKPDSEPETTARLVTELGEQLLEYEQVRAGEKGAKKVSTRLLSGDYADAILDAVDDTGADLVVMGSRGLGRLKSMMLGSVSNKVSQNAGCSVAIIR